jgi:hypothetical protein
MKLLQRYTAMKNNHRANFPPQKLYKYLSQDRLDVLTDQMIRYTPLGFFNDPFEGIPYMDAKLTQIHMMQEISKKSFQEEYDNLPKSIKNKISRYDYISIFKNEINKSENIQKSIESFKEHIEKHLRDSMDESIGALSLSEQGTNRLMWSHYASNGCGFALQFNANHAYFHKKLNEQDELRHLRKVLYKTEKPNKSFFNFMGKDYFFTKHKDWSYEKEWRILLPLNQATKIVGKNIRLFSYPANALEAVILGPRTPHDIILKIIEIIGKNPNLHHIKILNTKTINSSYKLILISHENNNAHDT